MGILHAVILLLLYAGCVDVAKGQTTDPTEVSALKAIKGNLIDALNNLKNWGSGDPCTSNWTGIYCDKIPSDSYLHVTEIQLFKMNLSGTLAPEVGLLSQLKTLDFMWNNLTGNIPKEVGNITTLKLIILNGNQLSGSLPDEIGYLVNLTRLQIDENNISGAIPKSFANLTSMKHLLVDNNNLSGPLPPELAETHSLQILSLRNCSLQGAVPDLSGIPNFGYLDLSWNQLKGDIPTNRLASAITTIDLSHNFLNGTVPPNFSGLPNLQLLDFQNNSFDTIPPAFDPPKPVTVLLYGNPVCTTSNAARAANLCQPKSLNIERFMWETGPRLNMHLKLFPDNTNLFNLTEVVRLTQVLAGWQITLSDVFGPYELLNITLGSYADEFPTVASSGLKRSALAGILVGSIVAAIALSVLSTVFIMKKKQRKRRTVSRGSLLSRFSVKVDGVKCFTFEEMAAATGDFNISAQVGQGGYGKVYKGVLADGTAVAIKRAHQDSLQGSKEFCTEIELLSRLHHRNLVSLVGYCDEEDEQRLHIALGASKGILYLHTEADPPIFHRDVKASNILLDSKFVAKVADFGLSRLAPVPDTEGTLPAHISTVVKGTPGYLDPEYFLTHKLTERSDVYSLGVVFLELLTGMKPIQYGKNIVREVRTSPPQPLDLTTVL
ncbi:hypothetical protein HU200_004923 [Digitaria exilis]|uniref:non-specific serine/threonine protein kinase n=1 Tax=Digitaria exilis TaxID=1010633 RepID=A0A835FT62_9POAL|nr:hypothetical protein HU200_004923 [Digitaria exilis]